VFRVRVKFKESPEFTEARQWLRPGMKGVGKIDVGRRSYLAIWSRDIVNWVRMKLWI